MGDKEAFLARRFGYRFIDLQLCTPSSDELLCQFDPGSIVMQPVCRAIRSVAVRSDPGNCAATRPRSPRVNDVAELLKGLQVAVKLCDRDNADVDVFAFRRGGNVSRVDERRVLRIGAYLRRDAVSAPLHPP